MANIEDKCMNENLVAEKWYSIQKCFFFAFYKYFTGMICILITFLK